MLTPKGDNFNKEKRQVYIFLQSLTRNKLRRTSYLSRCNTDCPILANAAATILSGIPVNIDKHLPLTVSTYDKYSHRFFLYVKLWLSVFL